MRCDMAENMNYDQNHMSRLQQDAIRRAREMQARARSSPPRNTNNRQPPHTAEHYEEQQKPPVQSVNNGNAAINAGHNTKPAEPGHSGELLDYLMKDSERTLILFLLILLIEEKADTGLIFALLYLII